MQRPRRTVIISAIGILLIGLASFAAYELNNSPRTQNDTIAAKPQHELSKDRLLELVNAERAKVNVAPLIADSRLGTSAQLKADDMTQNKYYGHDNPKTGKHGYEYISEVGIYCARDSENLVGATTEEEAVESWVKSPAHYKAMIDPTNTLTGFGISNNKIVEHFCVTD